MQRPEAGDNRFVAVDAFGPGAADLGPLRVVSRQWLSLTMLTISVSFVVGPLSIDLCSAFVLSG